MFGRFRSSGNQTRYNRKNQEIDLEYLSGDEIDRSIIRDRSICMKSTFADQVKWTRSIGICSAFFLFCIMIWIDRSVRPSNFGLIDPAWSNTLFIIFKNYKDIITILKIISLIGHKIYEISINGHSYNFFAPKNNFPKFLLLLQQNLFYYLMIKFDFSFIDYIFELWIFLFDY